MADHAEIKNDDSYTPIFSAHVRTWIYIICVIVAIIANACNHFGYADIGGFLNDTATYVGLAFAVAYNPIRMAGK